MMLYHKPRRFRATVLLALLLPLAAIVGCDAIGDDPPGDPIERDLSSIQSGDTLTALVTFNATSYFIYRGEPMGFEYRLLLQFAADHDLVLRARVVRDRSRLFHMLNEGEGDVVAARVVPAPSDTAHVAYTNALYTTRPAAVQRTEPAESAEVPEEVDTILQPRDSVRAPRDPVEIQARLLDDPGDLAGREVHVPRATFYEDRLIELSDSVGDEIHVVQVEDAGHEALLRRLARGEITLTVSPENLAELKTGTYTNLTVQPVIGAEHEVVWAVRENAPELQNALNEWIAANQSLIEQAYQRYFVDRQGFREREESEYLTSETGRLSEYDEILKAAAPRIGWDWRLLAAQTFQESKFDPRARSWAGAMGLLQLMPATAQEVDVSNPYDPEENVAGAVRYLDWLTDQWADSIPDEEQRLRFILASYNAGAGHVGDARRLAVKNGDDPNDWNAVSYWLLQKSKRQYYNDPVVRYGYARGMEPVLYVARILDRFDHYREFVIGEGTETTDGDGGAGDDDAADSGG